MFKISMNFDSRKLQRELEKQVRDSAEKQVRSSLRDLSSKGLRVSFRPGVASRFHIQLEGPEELVKEAKRRLN